MPARAPRRYSAFVPTISATASTRGPGHHSAASCQPGTSSTRITSNGLPGTSRGTFRCGTPSRAAIAAQSRLWRSRSWTTPAGGPSAAARSIASASSTGSTSQTPSSPASAWPVRVRASSGEQEKPEGNVSKVVIRNGAEGGSEERAEAWQAKPISRNDRRPVDQHGENEHGPGTDDGGV